MKRALLLGLCWAIGAGAQAPAFDVVSIKPTADRPPNAMAVAAVRAGRWQERNVSLAALVAYAYDLHCCGLTVTGGPAWVTQQGFAITGTVGSPTVATDDQRAMVRQLLLDRFHLVSHAASAVMPVDVLGVAPGGAKLRTAAGNCAPTIGPHPLGTEGSAPLYCGITLTQGKQAGQQFVHGRAITMTALAAFFEAGIEPRDQMRPLLDRTGLTGAFDFDFSFTMLNAPGGGPAMNDPDTAYSNLLGVQREFARQLGLSLDFFKPVKLPVPIRIVDAAQMPSN